MPFFRKLLLGVLGLVACLGPSGCGCGPSGLPSSTPTRFLYGIDPFGSIRIWGINPTTKKATVSNTLSVNGPSSTKPIDLAYHAPSKRLIVLYESVRTSPPNVTDPSSPGVVSYEVTLGGNLINPIVGQILGLPTTARPEPQSIAIVGDKVYVGFDDGAGSSPVGIAEMEIQPSGAVVQLGTGTTSLTGLDPTSVYDMDGFNGQLISARRPSQIDVRNPDSSGRLANGFTTSFIDAFTLSVDDPRARLFVGGFNGRLGSYSISSTALTTISSVNPALYTSSMVFLKIHPSGTTLFVGGDFVRTISSFEVAPDGSIGSVRNTVDIPSLTGAVFGVDCSEDGSLLFVLSQDNSQVYLYDALADGSIGALTDTVASGGVNKILYVNP